MRFLSCFWPAFTSLFQLYVCVFWPCTQKAERPHSTHPPIENVIFSRCTLAPALPQGRQPMVKKDFKNEKNKNIKKKMSGSRRRPPKKKHQQWLGEAQEAPRGPREGPKSRQEPPQEPLRGLEGPGRPNGPGGHFGPTWRPEAPWRPPGPHFSPS